MTTAAMRSSEKRNGLSPTSEEAVRNAHAEVRREAREASRILYVGIVRIETSHISSDDCFAALCLAHCAKNHLANDERLVF